MAAQQPKYIESQEVASLVKNGLKDDVLLIDVRDDDFGYLGYVKGSINIEVSQFSDDDQIDMLIQVGLGLRSYLVRFTPKLDKHHGTYVLTYSATT